MLTFFFPCLFIEEPLSLKQLAKKGIEPDPRFKEAWEEIRNPKPKGSLGRSFASDGSDVPSVVQSPPPSVRVAALATRARSPMPRSMTRRTRTRRSLSVSLLPLSDGFVAVGLLMFFCRRMLVDEIKRLVEERNRQTTEDLLKILSSSSPLLSTKGKGKGKRAVEEMESDSDLGDTDSPSEVPRQIARVPTRSS